MRTIGFVLLGISIMLMFSVFHPLVGNHPLLIVSGLMWGFGSGILGGGE